MCILFSCQLVAMCKCANDAFCPELLALEEEEEEEEGVYNRKVLCTHSREQEQRERERTGWGELVVVVYLLQ